MGDMLIYSPLDFNYMGSVVNLEKHKLIDFDWLITNGVPSHDDKSITGRIEKGWSVVATLPAKLIHPHAADTDKATIFAKYTAYPKDENQLPDASC